MTDRATELRQFIEENFLFGVNVQYANCDSLLENGVIDSTGVLELIAHLESEYGFRVQDEDLVPENLDSIDGIVQFLQRKTTSEAVVS